MHQEKMYGSGEYVRMNGLDIARKFEMAVFNVKIFELNNLGGYFYNSGAKSLRIDSDKYLFCRVK